MLQRYHIGYDHHPEESAMMHDDGYWVKASEAIAVVEKMKCCGNCNLELNGCDEYACYGKDRDRRTWELRI